MISPEMVSAIRARCWVMAKLRPHLGIVCFLLTATLLNAQSTHPFQQEVDEIRARYMDQWDPNTETYVFTGSSSIRLWTDLNALFPDKQIINTGFGGSQASDLDMFLQDLVLRYQPTKVFIYEGDNDIAFKKRPHRITSTIKSIIDRITANQVGTKVYLIAAKPSISRWTLRRKYKRLNRKMARLAKKDASLFYIDVWHPMLNGNKLRENIFLEDGLHMNANGYQLWYNAIKDFVNH